MKPYEIMAWVIFLSVIIAPESTGEVFGKFASAFMAEMEK